MKILVVEDHPKLRGNIIAYLQHQGYLAEGAIHGQEALEKASLGKYDLIILDSHMPIMDGESFLRAFRKKNLEVPIISLTSESMLEDKQKMFTAGVDDYMVKPVSLAELLLRIQALTRRSSRIVEEEIVIGDLRINISRHRVCQKGEEITLSNKLYQILELLARNKGIPLSKNTILQKVWGEAEERLELSSTTLEAHISTLRKKLGKNLIETIKGSGYRIP